MIMNQAFLKTTDVEFPNLLIIAGEQSGDEHAAKIVNKLLHKNPAYNICAIGGENLASSGAEFLFNLVDYSVVGVAEVLKNIKFFSKLIKEICDWVEKYQPKAVCFVDFPGMNLRIAQELYKRKISRKSGGNVALYHYISPQIWAWKAKRRFSIAKYIDRLGTIFPFEKECYKDTILDVQFLGHPFLDTDYELPVGYDPTGPILLLPGSRKLAVKKIFPIMLDTVKQLLKVGERRELVCIYPTDDILDVIEKIARKYKNLSIQFIKSNSDHISAGAAIMSSGTMALNCALAGIPGVIVYKANVLTYGLAKVLLKVKFLHIANLLLKRESAPEFLQYSAKPKLICKAVQDALNNPERIESAQNDAEELKQILRSDDSMNVCSWLQEVM